MRVSFMSVTRTVSRSMNSDWDRDLPSHDVRGGVMVEDDRHRVGTRRTNCLLCNDTDGANAAAAAAALLITLPLSAVWATIDSSG